MELKTADVITYSVLIGGIALLLYSLFGVQPGQNSGATTQLAGAPPINLAECGDLNDIANIQHLSHHPDQNKECLRQVDPAKFRQATGQELSAFIK